jgi:hypothetical protein
MNTRMLPLAGTSVSGNIGGGAGCPILRSYAASAGGFIDAVGDPSSGDASSLVSQGFIAICASGTTSQRPIFASTSVGVGLRDVLFLDTSLGKIIVFDGVSWRDPVTGNAV